MCVGCRKCRQCAGRKVKAELGYVVAQRNQLRPQQSCRIWGGVWCRDAAKEIGRKDNEMEKISRGGGCKS